MTTQHTHITAQAGSHYTLNQPPKWWLCRHILHTQWTDQPPHTHHHPSGRCTQTCQKAANTMQRGWGPLNGDVDSMPTRWDGGLRNGHPGSRQGHQGSHADSVQQHRSDRPWAVDTETGREINPHVLWIPIVNDIMAWWLCPPKTTHDAHTLPSLPATHPSPPPSLIVGTGMGPDPAWFDGHGRAHVPRSSTTTGWWLGSGTSSDVWCRAQAYTAAAPCTWMTHTHTCTTMMHARHSLCHRRISTRAQATAHNHLALPRWRRQFPVEDHTGHVTGFQPLSHRYESSHTSQPSTLEYHSS